MAETKACYIKLLTRGSNYEIAESFYNSIFCNIFKHEHLSEEFAFVLSSKEPVTLDADEPIYTSYRMHGGLKDLIDDILTDYAFGVSYEDKARDVQRIVEVIETQI